MLNIQCVKVMDGAFIILASKILRLFVLTWTQFFLNIFVDFLFYFLLFLFSGIHKTMSTIGSTFSELSYRSITSFEAVLGPWNQGNWGMYHVMGLVVICNCCIYNNFNDYARVCSYFMWMLEPWDLFLKDFFDEKCNSW